MITIPEHRFNSFNDFIKWYTYRPFRIVEIQLMIALDDCSSKNIYQKSGQSETFMLMLKLTLIPMIENVKNSTWHETKHFNTLSHLLRKSNENLNRKRIFQNMNQLHWLCNVVFILAINPVQLVLLIVHMINRISRIKIAVHKTVIVQNDIALLETKNSCLMKVWKINMIRRTKC